MYAICAFNDLNCFCLSIKGTLDETDTKHLATYAIKKIRELSPNPTILFDLRDYTPSNNASDLTPILNFFKVMLLKRPGVVLRIGPSPTLSFMDDILSALNVNIQLQTINADSKDTAIAQLMSGSMPMQGIAEWLKQTDLESLYETHKIESPHEIQLFEPIRIFTTPYYLNLFELDQIGIKTVSREIQELIKLFMETGRDYDLCIMPYIDRYKDLLFTFRAKKLVGSIVFVAEKHIDTQIHYDLHKRGAILIDIRHERKQFIKYLIMFLVEEQQKIRNIQALESMRQAPKHESIANFIHSAYQGGPPKGEAKPPSNSQLTTIIDSIVDTPEKLPFEKLIAHRGFQNASCSLTIESFKSGNNETISVFCMADVAEVIAIKSPQDYSMVIFKNYRPAYMYEVLKTLATKTTAKDVLQAIRTKNLENKPANAVQAIIKLDDIDRNFLLLPFFTADKKIGFVPLSDAFLQRRRFFRIAPPPQSPISVIVSSADYQTHKVPIINISEQGVAFSDDRIYPKKSDVNLFLKWQGTEIICQGTVQNTFEQNMEKHYKIGVEMYPHPLETEMIRKYVFDCQVHLLKMGIKKNDA